MNSPCERFGASPESRRGTGERLTARFLLCVNGDGGIPTGHIEGVDFMDADGVRLELRACIWPVSACPRFSRLDGAIRVSRRTFPILGYKEWVGNWSWDAVAMGGATGAEFLNYLKFLGWQSEGGMSPYFEMWEKGEKFRPSDAAVLSAEQLMARKMARALAAPPKGSAQPPDGGGAGNK